VEALLSVIVVEVMDDELSDAELEGVVFTTFFVVVVEVLAHVLPEEVDNAVVVFLYWMVDEELLFNARPVVRSDSTQ
jgi:hypothetical protein